MSAKIEAIAEQAPEFVKKLILEAKEDLEKALVIVAEEAQAQDTEANLTVNFSIKIMLDKDQIDYGLAYGIRRKLTASAKLPDPEEEARRKQQEEEDAAQDLFRRGGGTVTISGDGIQTLKVGLDEFERKLSKLKDNE